MRIKVFISVESGQKRISPGFCPASDCFLIPSSGISVNCYVTKVHFMVNFAIVCYRCRHVKTVWDGVLKENKVARMSCTCHCCYWGSCSSRRLCESKSRPLAFKVYQEIISNNQRIRLWTLVEFMSSGE